MKYIYIILALVLLFLAGFNIYETVIGNEDTLKKIRDIISALLTIFASVLLFAKAIIYDDKK